MQFINAIGAAFVLFLIFRFWLHLIRDKSRTLVVIVCAVFVTMSYFVMVLEPLKPEIFESERDTRILVISINMYFCFISAILSSLDRYKSSSGMSIAYVSVLMLGVWLLAGVANSVV